MFTALVALGSVFTAMRRADSARRDSVAEAVLEKVESEEPAPELAAAVEPEAPPVLDPAPSAENEAPARAEAPETEAIQDPPEEAERLSTATAEPALDGEAENPIIPRLQETEEV